MLAYFRSWVILKLFLSWTRHASLYKNKSERKTHQCQKAMHTMLRKGRKRYLLFIIKVFNDISRQVKHFIVFKESIINNDFCMSSKIVQITIAFPYKKGFALHLHSRNTGTSRACNYQENCQSKFQTIQNVNWSTGSSCYKTSFSISFLLLESR